MFISVLLVMLLPWTKYLLSSLLRLNDQFDLVSPLLPSASSSYTHILIAVKAQNCHKQWQILLHTSADILCVSSQEFNLPFHYVMKKCVQLLAQLNSLRSYKVVIQFSMLRYVSEGGGPGGKLNKIAPNYRLLNEI